MNSARHAAFRAALALTLLLITLTGSALADDPAPDLSQYLPAGDIGADDFIAAHPGWDGRGAVIAVLDTGVDEFAPGLSETSTGQHKILDVRDFTPEGEWSLEKAELEDDALVHPDGMRLTGFADLDVPPAADEPGADPVWFGIIPERAFRNSGDVSDYNDDGDRDDSFGVLVYTAERKWVEHALGVGRGLEFLAGLNETAAATVAEERASDKCWVVVVDTDADGDLADEKVLRDYHVDWDVFKPVNRDAAESRTLMAWSVNVRENEDFLGRPEAPTLETHFDSGSHGSHCAGIAAGHDVSGQPGIDGVAPGAWLISCKLGDNRLAGGATRTESMKKAYRYAQSFGEKYGLPVVVNMSFGINSVEEGEDAMGSWLDDFMAEHPEFVVCTSAGNEGPGLSSIGIPATCTSIISSGAYLSRESGTALYSARMTQDAMFGFSSRGGESPKPDIVSPGTALSTVPGHVEGSARYNGTSMASPQTAGAVALLLGAAADKGYDVHWGMIKRALIGGGVPVEGLGLLDQGGGLLNVENSWRLLDKLARSETAKQVLDYAIEVACPFQTDGLATAAYWRTPGGVPEAPERVRFTVTPIFHPDMTPDMKDTFFRSFSFKSEASWLRTITRKSYIRGDMGMTVDVEYDGGVMDEPGLRSARVLATQDGGDLSGLAGREFALWNTIVVGDRVGPGDGYMKTWQGEGIAPSKVRRHYIVVPAGATAMRARLEVSDRIGARKGAAAYLELCNPEGAVRGGWIGYASPEAHPVREATLLPPDLTPGIWELNVVAAIGNLAPTDYELTVAFDGYACEPAVVTELPRAGTGEPAAGSVRVTRVFPGVFRGVVAAAVEGFRGESEISIEEKDSWSKSFTLDRVTPRVSFHLEMDEKTANYFTDCAVNIAGSDGRDITATGFDGLICDIGASLPAGVSEVTYTLKVTGGFAEKADMEEWGFTLEEKYKLAAPVAGEVERAGGGALRLYSGVPTDLDVSFAGSWPEPPEGMRPYGALTFTDARPGDRKVGDRGGRVCLEIPIRLD